MNLTFEEAYKKYIEYAKLYLKPTTILNQKRKIENHILPYFKEKNIYDFKEEDYIMWQSKIKGLNYSKSFNNSIQSIIKNFFDFLFIKYKIENIPRKIINFKDFKIEEKKEVKILNIKDFKKFINTTKKNILYNTLFDFLYFTGVRKGELLALKWKDLNKKEIIINKSITKELFNGKRLEQAPKSKKSIRKIKIDNKLYKKLIKLKKYYKKKYNDFSNDYYIFGGLKPIATTTLDRYKNKYCDKAKIERISIHCFRHSHATILFKSNCDIKTIQNRLGHANIETTLNIYVHENKEKRVIRALNFIKFIF